MSKDNLKFPAYIKQAGWRVTKDEIGDEIIALTKRSNSDHIYPLSDDRFGVWLTSGKINRTISRLEKCSGCIIEQLGNGEAVLSWPYDSFNAVAKILHPAKKRKITAETRERLKKISPFTPHTGRDYASSEPKVRAEDS